MGRLLLTTSREPSRRTRSFVKDLTAAVPHSMRLNRGKSTYRELALRAASLGAYGVLLVLERRGNPSSLLFATPGPSGLRREFLLKLSGVSLLRELPDAQVPLGLRELVLVYDSIPSGLPEVVAGYLIRSLRPRIVDRAEGRVVELKLLGGEREALVTFMCATSDRECGPRFGVAGVVDYSTTTG